MGLALHRPRYFFLQTSMLRCVHEVSEVTVRRFSTLESALGTLGWLRPVLVLPGQQQAVFWPLEFVKQLALPL
jgi:hypothetical protein